MCFSDFLRFIFPCPCLVCGEKQAAPGSVMCLNCEFRIPRTGFTPDRNNPLSQIFWGRTDVQMATSMFRFEKGSAYQGLLHELKYRGNRKAGIYLGILLGRELQDSPYASVDLLLPVPLHRQRHRERGYNQGELIARGVGSVLNIPVENRVLQRHSFLQSQTSLGRFERYENVKNDFSLRPAAPEIHDRKVLLVDDVLTTGATLEACARVLSGHFRCQLLVATVACA